MPNTIAYILVGLTAGILSGLIGIGGGIIIVPALIYLFHLAPHTAQGTTLALMVPPIGLLAALTYYKQGYVDISIAAFICMGFFVGGLLGANLASLLSGTTLKRIFGLIMLLVSIKMILGK